MESLQIFVLLIAVAVILMGLSLKMHIPYPIMLMIGGCCLGFIPVIDEINLNPNLILGIVLPPILYYAAYSIRFKEFQRNIREILWLALGLVIVTTIIIGFFFKLLFPDLPWAIALAFGAIISPPDAAASTSVLKRFSINSRLRTILEGESLINDATGLVLYKLAVLALLSGHFSVNIAFFEFTKVVLGGIAVGVILGYLLHYISSRFFDSVVAVIFSFTIPYITFLVADAFDVSGVLAVVISGLIGARMQVTHFTSLTRVVGWASWDIAIIILNCFVFIIIGLALHDIVERITIDQALIYIGYGILLTLAIILIRFIWIYTSCWINWRKKEIESKYQSSKEAIILGWSSMRGIVSLTAALGLPYTLRDGALLPGRDIVIFLTFIVILITLLLPGLTLSQIIQRLNMRAFDEDDTKNIRNELMKAASKELERLRDERQLDDQECEFILTYFKHRHKMLEISTTTREGSHTIEFARLRVLQTKRECLLRMLENEEVSDGLFNLLEHEIDLEESYIIRAEI